MSRNVKISTLGPNMPNENPGTGQQAVDRMIEFWQGRLDQVLPDRPDIIVVPEACDRYRAHSPAERLAYYAVRGNQVRDLFAGVARSHNCYIAYSAMHETAGGTWLNSTQLIGRDGRVLGAYHKNHPTIPEMDKGIVPGADTPIFECDFGRVGCAICFDLNFDDVRLRYARSRHDLILFSSVYHGGMMQEYWAYSCRTHFVAAVERMPSAIISPVGQVLASTTNYFDSVTATVNLDCKVVHLDFNWERLTAMKKRYGPQVSVFDPGFLGAVLISSESEDMTSDDLVDEYGFELLDDYLDRSRDHLRADATEARTALGAERT